MPLLFILHPSTFILTMIPPGYKQTEVGVIPEDWDSSKIGDFSFVTKLAGFEYTLHFDYSKSGPVIAVRALNIKNGTLDLKEVHTIPRKTSDDLPRSKLVKGDLVISYVGTLGRVAMIPEDDKFHLAPNVAKICVDKARVAPEFLAQFLNSFTGQKLIFDAAASTTQAALSMGNLREIVFVRPPLAEQRAIATALSDVDALLAALDRLIAKQRDLKQAAMQQLLTGQTRLPGFKGEWETKRLGDLFNFSGGYSASRDQLSTEGHCYLHYGDIHGSSKTCIDTEADFQDIPKLDIPLKRVSPASLLADGDVVFVDASEDDAGTSKHVVVVNKGKKPFISGLHTIVAKSKTDELAHEYRHYCFQTPAIRQQFLFYAVGTKVSGISKSNIPKLTLTFPLLPEQTAIATVLSDLDAELAVLVQRRDKTRALKQGMMQELLTGRTRLV